MTTENFADYANSDEGFTVDESGKIIVGDRTFDSQADLIKSWQHQSGHIQTIEGENGQMREQLAKAKGVEDVLEKLREQQEPPTETTSQQSEVQDSKEFLKAEDLDEMLTQRELNRVAKQNKQKAMDMAKEVYGGQFQTNLQETAQSLGMTESEALSIAERSPEAFSKLFLPSAPSIQSRASGDINSGAVRPPSEVQSARVGVGASTPDLVRAWNNAAPKIEE